MKMIEAWVQSHDLDAVTAAANNARIRGVTATTVRSVGNQVIMRTLIYRGASYAMESLPRIKLEMVVHDDLAERLIAALITASQNAHVGDWEVCVLRVDDAIRIRTGEIGAAAIA